MSCAKFLCLFLSSICFLSSVVHAQVTITQEQGLSFGSIIIEPSGDTITLRVNGNITSANGSNLLGGESPATFRFEGPRNTSVSYSFSANNVLNGNGEAVSISNFTANRPNPFNLTGSGVREMDVGADLIIPNGLNGGSFSGTFMLIIDNP